MFRIALFCVLVESAEVATSSTTADDRQDVCCAQHTPKAGRCVGVNAVERLANESRDSTRKNCMVFVTFPFLCLSRLKKMPQEEQNEVRGRIFRIEWRASAKSMFEMNQSSNLYRTKYRPFSIRYSRFWLFFVGSTWSFCVDLTS
jgi:hypothetical protein